MSEVKQIVEQLLVQAAAAIPIGLCQCGCGRRTRIAPQTHRPIGWVKGQPIRYVHGHGPSQRGRKLPARPSLSCPDCNTIVVACFMSRHKPDGQPCVRTETFAQALPRFMQHVQRDSLGCWLWTASTDPKGYAQFDFRTRNTRGHRFVYEALVGRIPEGLDLDHLCRVRRCVNPAHLEPVTRAENLRRGYKHRNQHSTNGIRQDAGASI